jgi:MFS family permease
VGLTVGIQFVAMVLTRGYAGRLTDRFGGKRSALQGATVCAMGGLLYLSSATPSFSPALGLAFVIVGRVVAGFGESQLVTGCISWSIASVGQQRAGMSMSRTGVAMYAAIAIGAPIGMALFRSYGLQSTMLASFVAPLVAAAIALREVPYSVPAGKRLHFLKVVGQIWRAGVGLMLQGVGLSALAAFGSLYFAVRNWGHAGLVMTAFGIGFIFVRLVFGRLTDRVSGYQIALWSLLIEATGQMTVWLAPAEIVAIIGALVTGLGCALIFPALGVEALKRVPPANRGSAMGAFVAFLDIANGASGPVAGAIAGHYGYAAVYLIGASSALLGAGLILATRRLQS